MITRYRLVLSLRGYLFLLLIVMLIEIYCYGYVIVIKHVILFIFYKESVRCLVLLSMSINLTNWKTEN